MGGGQEGRLRCLACGTATSDTCRLGQKKLLRYNLCIVVVFNTCRDARRLDVLRKADGTPPDLPRRADLLVYEVGKGGRCAVTELWDEGLQSGAMDHVGAPATKAATAYRP